MHDQDVVKMIHGLEAQIKSLKHHLKISDEPEELEEEMESVPMTHEVGRGRKKRTVPTMGKSMDNELGEGEKD